MDTLSSYYRSSRTEIEIDMTKTITYWYEHPETFHSIVINKENENCCCCNNVIKATYLDLYSLKASYSYRPKLYSEYTSADMYADHQKYHTFENGSHPPVEKWLEGYTVTERFGDALDGDFQAAVFLLEKD